MATIRVYDTTGQAVRGVSGLFAQAGAFFSFTDTVAGPEPLTQVQLDLADASGSTDGGSVTVTLYSSSGTGASSMPGTAIATLGTISDTALSSTPTLVTLAVPAGIVLTYGVRYWIQMLESTTSRAGYAFEADASGTGASGEYYNVAGQTYPDTNDAAIASVSVTIEPKVYDTTSQAVIGTDTAIQQGGSSAFSFTDTVAGSGTLTQVRLDLADANGSTDGGSVTVTLYSDSGTGASLKPGTAIATLGTIADMALGSMPTLVTLAVPAGIVLTYGVRYWIQMTGSSTSQAQDAYEADASGTGAAGEYFYENGATGPNSDGAAVASVAVTPACFCPGTSIRTPGGDVAVETLSIGDQLVTASGRIRAVKWLGRRSYMRRFVAANPALWPVRIRAGALGGGVPVRDLLLSGQHALLLDRVLVPAGHLVGAPGITVERPAGDVHYIHVELESHDVILAEGAAAETFLDDDSRGIFQNAAEFAALYPDAPTDGRFCAPRVNEGLRLEAIRRRLAGMGRPAAA